jgi:hypothetical protein
MLLNMGRLHNDNDGDNNLVLSFKRLNPFNTELL